jgi:hypothetical protein
MLGMKTYPADYIRNCRDRIDTAVATYRTLANPSPEFEASYFSNLVLVLDEMFVHRLRAVEGKDGNAMNEVRVLCESMLLHGNVMTPEKTIKLAPERSVTGIADGDAVELNEAKFVALSDAFFRDIEARFSEAGVAAAV